MNVLLYHIASGHAFFLGTGLILGAVVLRGGSQHRLARFASTIAALLGAVLVAISGTPLPLWFYGAVAIVLAIWLAVDRPGAPRRALLVGVRSALVGVCLLGIGRELPYHFTPAIPFDRQAPLFVIGDSFSAGMTDNEPTWPRQLRTRCGLDVRDFSHVGATAESAMRQAEQVDGPGLVLVEIGGNDILGAGTGTPPAEFTEHLESLLSRLVGEGRTVVMLELPLPPFENEFGRVQRQLARRHRVQLVPKRVFIDVLTTPGATVDGVHLSPAGHEQMAQHVARLLKCDLKE